MASALEALHAMQVLLRSVSAGQLLVEESGYIVVTEMRSARLLQGELAYSMAGPPDALAPEVDVAIQHLLLPFVFRAT